MDYYEQNYIEVKLNELVLYDSPFLKALRFLEAALDFILEYVLL